MENPNSQIQAESPVRDLATVQAWENQMNFLASIHAEIQPELDRRAALLEN